MKKPQPNSEALPASWLAVEAQLRSAEMLAPRSGFAGRWLARAAGQPAAYKPGKLAWLGLAGGAVLSASLLGALLAVWLPLLQLQPGAWLAELVRFASLAAVTLRVLLTTISNLFSDIPLAAWLVASTTALAGLLLLAVTVDKVKVFKETK